MINCEGCGQELKLIPAGISKKSGKPYKAFYAHVEKTSCDWVPPTPPQSVKAPPETGINTKELIVKEDNDKIKSMVMSYAKDLVCAELQSRSVSTPLLLIAKPCDLVITYFEKLLTALRHPKQEVTDSFSPFNNDKNEYDT